MKRLLLILLLQTSLHAEKLNLKIHAESAILINADTEAILFEKKPHDLHYPASITKIATAYYALLQAEEKWEELVTADQDSIGTVKEEDFKKSNYTLPAYYLIPDGSHIGIKRGEVLSFKDLMFGLMVSSGDDAANVIAKFVSGSIPKFVQEMNEEIKKIGCKSTIFYNPHGLHHPKQQTTAYDMAHLTIEALKHPKFRELISTPYYTRPKTNKQEATTLVQTNRLLRKGAHYYPKAIGGKTGFYSLAGSTLVTAAQDGGRTLIAVLLKNEDRKEMFHDAVKLFEAAFNQPKVKRILLKQGHKFERSIEGAGNLLTACLAEDITLEYFPAEEPKVKCLLHWQPSLKIPIQQGDLVAEVSLEKNDGTIIQTIPLYAQSDVNLRRWFSGDFNKWLGGIFIFLFLGFFFFKVRIMR